MEQLSLFDLSVENEYEVKDIVKVKEFKKYELNGDIESYYYLKEFERMTGEIIEVIEKPKIQYCVDFGNTKGYFYQNELKKIM